MVEIKLLATDLDGTLIGSANELPYYPDFRKRLNELRRRNNTIWAVCTGRSLGSFRSFFSPMQVMDILPDFVIIRHAYIYGLTRFGYVPHLMWNLRTWYALFIGRFTIAKVIDEWHDMVWRFSGGVATVQKRDDRLWLKFDSENSAVAVTEMLRERAREYKHLQVFRRGSEVDVRPVPFTKGLALMELEDQVGIGPEHVLAIGNGHNDASMLDGKAAKLTGCPGNSETEVMETVHASGGHIAKGNALLGVMEVIDAHMNGTVSSVLPVWCQSPAEADGMRSRKPSSKSGRRRSNLVKILLAAFSFYTVLLVFASLGLIPFVSGYLMMPYRWLIRLIAWLFSLFS